MTTTSVLDATFFTRVPEVDRDTGVEVSRRIQLEPDKWRIWKGEDGTYMVLTFDEQSTSPWRSLSPGGVIEVQDGGAICAQQVVQRIEHDMKSAWTTVNTIDLAAYTKVNKVVSDHPDKYGRQLVEEFRQRVDDGLRPPPRFDSQVDADNWLALNDVPRQIFATGSIVTFEKVMPLARLKTTGLVVPNHPVEFVGKVVSFKASYVTSSGDGGPHYQILAVLDEERSDPELTWVRASDIHGLA